MGRSRTNQRKFPELRYGMPHLIKISRNFKPIEEDNGHREFYSWPMSKSSSLTVPPSNLAPSATPFFVVFSSKNGLKSPLTQLSGRPAVVLGNLDGVHRGHQALLTEAHRSLGGASPPVVVVTFNPHPVEVLAPQLAFRRIFSIEGQQKLLQEFRVSGVVYQKFDEHLAQLEAEDFLERNLWEPLQPARVVVGFNFRFGRGRSGGPEALRKWGERRGIEIKIVEPLRVGGETVSSTQIRQHLQHGEVMQAARLLGFPFFISGQVHAGAQRGKAMGYPTANIECPSTLVPKHGVYVTRVKVDGEFYEGVSHLGPVPTFSDPKPRVESFLLNFVGTIYNQAIIVEFLEWIREIQKFEDVEDLKTQIAKDIARAKEVHSEFRKIGDRDGTSSGL